MNLITRSGALLAMPFYAIRSGRTAGVYSSWDQAKNQIEGFSGAVHKKFKTQHEADAFVRTQGGYNAPIASSSSSSSSWRAPSDDDEPYHLPSYSAPTITPATITPTPAVVSVRQTAPVRSSAPPQPQSHRETPAPVKRGNEASSSSNLTIYTDGACKGNNNVQANNCPAGFGFVVLSKDNKVVAEIYAPVELSRTSEYFLGASVKSNNTAELSAIGEALLWVKNSNSVTCVCGSSSGCRCPPVSVSIRYDSEYAAKSVMGTFNGEKNRELYTNLRDIYKSVQKGGISADGGAGSKPRRPVEIKFEKVKGHSGDTWNDKADELANKGASGQICESGRYKKTDSESVPESSIGSSKPDDNLTTVLGKRSSTN